MRPARAAIKRVTSHAHFQLEVTDEVTDDEEDLSVSSRQSEEAEQAALRGDVAHRRALTRQESASSIKSNSSFTGGAGPLPEGCGAAGGGGHEGMSYAKSIMTHEGMSHAKSFMKRVVSRRCIDGVPLDELASKMAGSVMQSDVSHLASCTATSLLPGTDKAADGSNEVVSEAQMDMQAVQRYEDDLMAAHADYYSDPSRQQGGELETDMSPDLTPKHSPQHSPSTFAASHWAEARSDRVATYGQMGSSLNLAAICEALPAIPPLSEAGGHVTGHALSANFREPQPPARGDESGSTSSGALTPEEFATSAQA